MKKRALFVLGILAITSISIIFALVLHPIPIPQSPPTISPRELIPSIISSPQALAACDSSTQMKALFNQDHDLSNLGIATCYQLELHIDPDNPNISAKAQITFTNLYPTALPDLLFRLFPNSALIYGGKLNITSIRIENNPVTPEFLLDRTAIRLLLAVPLQVNQTIDIYFDYSLSLPVNFGSDKVYGIFNHSPDQNLLTLANWFPLLATRNNETWFFQPVDGIGDAVTSDVALFKVLVRAPPDWRIVTTGSEINQVFSGDYVAHHFVSGPTRDFMVVASPNLESMMININGVQIKQWGLPATRPGWQRSLDTAAAAVKSFSLTYGAYPYAELDLAAVPLNLAIGVEYPGLILIADKEYQSPLEATNEIIVVVAHEVAHQWWYGVVGNDVNLAPWQDEGLTTYSTLIFLQKAYPPIADFLNGSYQQRVASLITTDGNNKINQPVSAFVNRPASYSTVVYIKSALFFKALQARIGEIPLNSALSEYYKRYAFQIAKPDELLTILETTCKCDLTTLYRDWGLIN